MSFRESIREGVRLLIEDVGTSSDLEALHDVLPGRPEKALMDSVLSKYKFAELEDLRDQIYGGEKWRDYESDGRALDSILSQLPSEDIALWLLDKISCCSDLPAVNAMSHILRSLPVDESGYFMNDLRHHIKLDEECLGLMLIGTPASGVHPLCGLEASPLVISSTMGCDLPLLAVHMQTYKTNECQSTSAKAYISSAGEMRHKYQSVARDIGWNAEGLVGPTNGRCATHCARCDVVREGSVCHCGLVYEEDHGRFVILPLLPSSFYGVDAPAAALVADFPRHFVLPSCDGGEDCEELLFGASRGEALTSSESKSPWRLSIARHIWRLSGCLDLKVVNKEVHYFLTEFLDQTALRIPRAICREATHYGSR